MECPSSAPATRKPWTGSPTGSSAAGSLGRSRLPTEEEIGGELGVSRTVVREAMRTLVAKGMVEVRGATAQRPAIETWSLFDPQVVAGGSRAG